MTDDHVVKEVGQSRTSSTLLRAAAAEDVTAWGELVDLYGPLVYRFARRQGLQPACASDLVQEVLIAVVKNLKTFRHDRPGDSFRAWLLTIAWNKFYDRRRQEGRGPQAVGGTDAQTALLAQAFPQSATTSTSGTPDERLVRMRQAVEMVRTAVAADKWAMFCSLVIDGCPAEEVAEIYGTTTNVVYLAKSRIARRLDHAIRSLGNGG